MRTFLSGISVLLCGLLLTGAIGLNAPVMQSQSFYINDHAGVISQENRDNMLKTAQELYEKTNVRAVVLTIENLDGHAPEEYAEIIFKAWELGAGGNGFLILLSTKEKRFATWSNADISAAHSMDTANQLAEAGQFDLAASGYFFSIVDSIYSKYPMEEAAPESSKSESVHSESSDITERDSQDIIETQGTKLTEITPSTENARSADVKENTFYAVIILFSMIMFMNFMRTASRRRKAPRQNESIYLTQVYSPDNPIAVREDDIDYPSGFGGPGNRKAIYLEDVDAADDIGIIKRDDVEKKRDSEKA